MCLAGNAWRECTGPGGSGQALAGMHAREPCLERLALRGRRRLGAQYVFVPNIPRYGAG